MRCGQLRLYIDAHVDGELGAERTLEVGQHLGGCSTCRERVEVARALRASLRKVVRADAPVDVALRGRLELAMLGELARQQTRPREDDARRPLTGAEAGRSHVLRRVAPVLAAAAALLMMLQAREGGRPSPAAARRSSSLTEAPALASVEGVGTALPALTASVDQLLDELVDYHARPPAPQITEPTLVRELEPQVGVPVQLPRLVQYGAEWEGGSVIRMRDHRAAFFRYRVSNHPVTVYVYDARRVPLRGVLEPRVVHDQPVHVGAHRGYSIAVREQRGVGYAIATDLNDDESAELVAAIH